MCLRSAFCSEAGNCAEPELVEQASVDLHDKASGATATPAAARAARPSARRTVSSSSDRAAVSSGASAGCSDSGWSGSVIAFSVVRGAVILGGAPPVIVGGCCDGSVAGPLALDKPFVKEAALLMIDTGGCPARRLRGLGSGVGAMHAGADRAMNSPTARRIPHPAPRQGVPAAAGSAPAPPVERRRFARRLPLRRRLQQERRCPALGAACRPPVRVRHWIDRQPRDRPAGHRRRSALGAERRSQAVAVERSRLDAFGRLLKTAELLRRENNVEE
jgi:hypothetical protein